MKTIVRACILLFVLITVCSCARNTNNIIAPTGKLQSVAEAETSSAPTHLPSEPASDAVAPASTSAPVSVWKQDSVYTAWLTAKQGNMLQNMTTVPEPDDVVEMLPLIELVLAYRTEYGFYHEDMRQAAPLDENVHSVDNELYTWGLMLNLFCTYGNEHPDAAANKTPNKPYTLIIPKQAAEDFIKACFSQYVEGQAIPTEPPEGWSSAAVSYTGTEPNLAMTFDGSAYICDKGNYTRPLGSRQRFVIINSVEADGMYRLDILTIYGPDELNISGYRVELLRNDSPDAFGLSWRICRVIRRL